MGCPPPLKRRSTRSCKPAGGGSGARGEAVGALGAHAPLLERAGRVLLGGGGVRHGHEASRPARGGGEGGFAFSYFKSQKTLLALLLQDLGPWWAPSAFAGRGGAPEEVQASVRPREGARGHSRPILDWMGGGFLGPLFTEGNPHQPTTFVEMSSSEEDELDLSKAKGGGGRFAGGRVQSVLLGKKPPSSTPQGAPTTAPPSTLAAGCKGGALATPARGSHPPGACSCARRGS